MRLPVLLFASAALACAADLAVTGVAFRDTEDGNALSRPVFGPGVPVYLTFRVTGFAATREDKAVDIGYTIVTVDPSGRFLDEQKKGEVKVELAPEDKDWLPKIRYEVQVPPVPEPGKYTVRIMLEDRIAKKSTTASAEFTVERRTLPDTSALSIGNFRFMHSENDVTGTETGAVYKPGDTLWARFEVAGYKFGAKNRYRIQYGLALKDGAGKTIFAEPKAAAESEESFYPKLATSGEFSVKLGEDLAPGEYSLTIMVADEVGGQSAERAFPFRIQP